MSTAIQAYEGVHELQQFRDPEDVLAEAKKAATALTKVVSTKKNPVFFNKEQYLEFEDWQTVAKFYGCTVKTESTRFVEYGGVQGFEASAVVLDRNQNEVGRAESMCLNDEDNWGAVPVYEWKDELDANGKKIWEEGKNGKKGRYKGTRVEVGTKSKPLFQLKSMAQTRAGAKALKSIFSWVVVLAGYSPTPAEEMTGNEHPEDFGQFGDERPQVVQPGRTSEKKKEEPVQEGSKEEIILGKIESVKVAKTGTVWLTVDKKTLRVPAEKADDTQVVGALFKARVLKTHDEKVGEVYLVGAILETGEEPQTEAPKGEVLPPEEGKTTEVPEDVMETLMSNGSVKKASDLVKEQEETTKPGTIGKQRAQRLHIKITKNHKETGFTEGVLKKVMDDLGIEHLRDLESAMLDQITDWVEGKNDSWKEDFSE